MFEGSWKTTAAGILILVVVLANVAITILSDGFSALDIGSVVEGCTEAAIALGLMLARDDNVTSEESSAKTYGSFKP